jgi:hypothetical protein
MGFKDAVRLRGVEGLEKIEKARKLLKCLVCGTKNGACIQCDHKVDYLSMSLCVFDGVYSAMTRLTIWACLCACFLFVRLYIVNGAYSAFTRLTI